VVFDGEGNELVTSQVTNTKAGVSKFFERLNPKSDARDARILGMVCQRQC
jgi:hypothetical protein